MLTRLGQIFAFLLAVELASPAHAQPLLCTPEGATPFSLARLDEQGVLWSSGGQGYRLAGLNWPDRLEPVRRSALRETLASALAGETLAIKSAGAPDRWGVTPIHLFVSERASASPPFWVQAGLAERGLMAGWPELDGACWRALLAHERLARRAHRGVWAPRAQAARHRVIAASPHAHAGRRMVARFKVHSVRRSAARTYVNIVPFFRVGPSLSLSNKEAQAWTRQGRDPLALAGRYVVARFLSGPTGLLRARLAQGAALMPDDE